MANVIESRLISKGNWINSPDLIGTIVVDTDLTTSDINTVLPNNTDKYDRDFGLITSGSTVKLLMNNYWYLCQFNATLGVYDATLDRKSGQFLVMAKVDYIF